ncbi:MAG TPA: hypothetical protein VGB82_18075 [Alphaproteobacteria bacterium]
MMRTPRHGSSIKVAAHNGLCSGSEREFKVLIIFCVATIGHGLCRLGNNGRRFQELEQQFNAPGRQVSLKFRPEENRAEFSFDSV